MVTRLQRRFQPANFGPYDSNSPGCDESWRWSFCICVSGDGVVWWSRSTPTNTSRCSPTLLKPRSIIWNHQKPSWALQPSTWCICPESQRSQPASSSGHRFYWRTVYLTNPIRLWRLSQHHKHRGRSGMQKMDQQPRGRLQKADTYKQQHLPGCAVPQKAPCRQQHEHTVFSNPVPRLPLSFLTEEPLQPARIHACWQSPIETNGDWRQWTINKLLLSDNMPKNPEPN